MKEQFISGLPEEFGTKKRVKQTIGVSKISVLLSHPGAFIPISVPFLVFRNATREIEVV
jgi:hypothetical protein